MNPRTAMFCLVPFAAIAAHGPIATLAAPAPFERIQHTGRITAWHVAADGTVSIELEDAEQEPPRGVWFRSPADKTDSTRFEELMLETMLQMAKAREPLTVVYERDKERSGKTLEQGFPVVALTWGAPMADIAPDAAK